MWIRFDRSTLRVLHVSIPAFTTPASGIEDDIQMDDQSLPASPQFLVVKQDLSGFDVVLPPEEIARQTQIQKVQGELAKDPKILTGEERIFRIETFLGLDSPIGRIKNA